MQLGQSLYNQPGAAGGPTTGGEAGPGSPGGKAPGGDDVIDADFTDSN